MDAVTNGNRFINFSPLNTCLSNVNLNLSHRWVSAWWIFCKIVSLTLLPVVWHFISLSNIIFSFLLPIIPCKHPFEIWVLSPFFFLPWKQQVASDITNSCIEVLLFVHDINWPVLTEKQAKWSEVFSRSNFLVGVSTTMNMIGAPFLCWQEVPHLY